jgi:hypothetical protein
MIMENRLKLTIATLALFQAACGGGGSGSSTSVSPSVAGASIGGTVPGTLIEAFGDNGSYYAVDSSDNGTARHPFQLELPAGVGFHLVMVTGEGTPDEVITPIGFRDSSGRVRTRLMLNDGDIIDLGHVPLPLGRNAAAADDRDNNGVLDSPMILDDVGARNPLSQSDADDDGMDDWDDPDHGGYHYADHITDPQDHDEDGIPNSYDDDHQARSDDSDADGLPDSIDANRYNERDHANDELDDDCDHDGYNDGDRDHDGFHDDDSDRDGYHDDDLDHDGHHDGDDDHETGDDSGSCSGAPAPSDPAPTDPAPTDPAPADPAPTDPAPADPAPTDPAPTDPAPTDPAPTDPAPADPPAPDGQALYTDFCAGCHGPNGVRGSSANAISSAIASNRGGMGSLSSLTSTEIQAIANYLAQ